MKIKGYKIGDKVEIIFNNTLVIATVTRVEKGGVGLFGKVYKNDYKLKYEYGFDCYWRWYNEDDIIKLHKNND